MNKQHYSKEDYRKAVRNFWIVIIANILFWVACYFFNIK